MSGSPDPRPDARIVATRAEWDEAKRQNTQMRNTIEGFYGEEIWEQIDLFWEKYNQNKDEAYQWLEQNPKVAAAMDLKDAIIAADPTSLLSTYYGGIDTLERYWRDVGYRRIEAEIGMPIEEIWRLQNEYYDSGLSKAEQKKFKKDHPELAQYWNLNREWKQIVNQKVIQLGSLLKDKKLPEIREDLLSPSLTQQGFISGMLAAGSDQLAQMSGQEWLEELGEDLFDDMFAFVTEGVALSEVTMDELEEMAADLGIDVNYLIQLIGISILKGSFAEQ